MAEQPLLRTFLIEDLRVLELGASSGGSSDDSHVDWRATFSNRDPFDSHDEYSDARVLIGTLHAGVKSGWATVTVGALITPAADNADLENEELVDAIKRSSALETLYDFAHATLRPLAGSVNAKLELPHKAPDAEVQFYDGRADPDVTSELPVK